MNKAVDLINKRAELGIQLGLERIDRLLKELGSPHLGQKYIHIAGTNGKGSVSSFISKSLTEAGFKVGKFSSPKLYELADMYSIDGLQISSERLEQLAGRLEIVSEKLDDEGLKPTEFELQTALALLYFYEEGCDYSIIEVGLGGIEDATNIIRPILSVITSISFDHSNILGSTLLEIAEKKAGIIKQDVPVCTIWQEKEVIELIRSKAEEKGAPYFEVDQDDIELRSLDLDSTKFNYLNLGYELKQLGTYQLQNACLALLALDVLEQIYSIEIPYEARKRGLFKTYWKARFELIQAGALIVLDGAHNEAGIRELRKSLELYFPSKKLHAIFAVMKDKAVRDMLREVSSFFDSFMLPKIPLERALDAESIKALLDDMAYPGKVEIYADLSELAAEVYQAGQDEVYVAFGSLYYLENLRRELIFP